MAPNEDNLKKRPNGTELFPPPSNMKCVGINGYWYNVTNFIDIHPGGKIIESYIGKDATAVFNAFRHDKNVLKHRKPVGTYNMSYRHPADEEFEHLNVAFEKLGYFQTDWSFYIKKMTLISGLLGLLFYLVIYCHKSLCWRILAGVILTFFWQQVAFNIHDLMHTQIFRNRKLDGACGTILGTIGFGMSAHWWKMEHIEHHSMTNTVDLERHWIDPQMWESVWAQNEKMFPLFKSFLQRCAIRLQHITFTPLVVICGRVGILINSYSQEKRWYEWLAILAHWSWITFLFSWMPTWTMIFQVYGTACITEGILHFQLVLSHYCKDFIEVKEYHHTSWYVYMVSSTLNIDNPWWLDWFHGGLNFHIEHHLYPKLARKHLRTVAPQVEKICKKYGIKYEKRTFWGCFTKTFAHMRKTGLLL